MKTLKSQEHDNPPLSSLAPKSTLVILVSYTLVIPQYNTSIKYPSYASDASLILVLNTLVMPVIPQ